MINIIDALELSVEERSEVQKFEKDLDRVMKLSKPVIPDDEISKIEAILTELAQEMVQRGRKQADKINS